MCCCIIEIKIGMYIIAGITILATVGGLIDSVNAMFWVDYNYGPDD